MKRLIIMMVMLAVLVTWFVVRMTQKAYDSKAETEIVTPLTQSDLTDSL